MNLPSYDKLEKAGKGVTNRWVFIASDDPSVFTECRESYPDFEFLGNEELSKRCLATHNIGIA